MEYSFCLRYCANCKYPSRVKVKLSVIDIFANLQLGED